LLQKVTFVTNSGLYVFSHHQPKDQLWGVNDVHIHVATCAYYNNMDQHWLFVTNSGLYIFSHHQTTDWLGGVDAVATCDWK
jgi:hypothetical protein